MHLFMCLMMSHTSLALFILLIFLPLCSLDCMMSLNLSSHLLISSYISLNRLVHFLYCLLCFSTYVFVACLTSLANLWPAALERGKDSGLLLSEWHHWFTRRAFSRNGNLWSSWLAFSGMEPSLYEETRVKVMRAPVFLACHAWGIASIL